MACGRPPTQHANFPSRRRPHNSPTKVWFAPIVRHLCVGAPSSPRFSRSQGYKRLRSASVPGQRTWDTRPITPTATKLAIESNTLPPARLSTKARMRALLSALLYKAKYFKSNAFAASPYPRPRPTSHATPRGPRPPEGRRGPRIGLKRRETPHAMPRPAATPTRQRRSSGA